MLNKILNIYDYIEEKFLKIRPINVMLFICFILSYPNYVAIISQNLDPSWRFFLNYSWSNDIIFGKDAFFTYGPLGWLIRPQNIGNNLIIGFIFWNIIWGLFGYSLYTTGKLFVESKENYIAATIACLAYIFCGNISGDIYLVYVELLMLTLIIRNKKRFLCPFIAIYAVLFLMKFSSYYIITTAILVYCVFGILFKISNRITLFILICSFPTCLITYLIYNPSFYNLTEYIEGAIHISMGMNSAMSKINTEGPEWTILFIPLIALVLVLYAFLFFKAERKSSLVYLTLISSFFFFYKEGFVRHGGSFAFLSCSLVFSLILLNINWSNILPKFGHRSFSFFLITVLGLCFIYPQNSYNIVQSKYQKISNIVSALKSARNDNGKNAAQIPESFVSSIKDSTFGVFPWELSYAANTNNFINMPVFQNYAAYTPWLDEKNQKFFENSLKAPEYIVLDDFTIDRRWPFIETPRTFRALLENYHVEKKEGNHILLRRNEKKINAYGEPIVIKKEIIKGEYIEAPEEATFFSIKAKPSIVGYFVKVLWKIPEVNLTVEYENKKKRRGRLVTDNIDYLIPINYLGINPFIQNNTLKIKKMKISGLGARLLNDCEITFYKGGTLPSLVSNLHHHSNLDLSDYTVKDSGSSIKFNIDKYYSDKKNAYIRGWAYFINKDSSPIDVGYDIYVITDKGLFDVTYSDRKDVVDYFNLNILNSSKIGFSANVPSSLFYQLVFVQKNFKTALTIDISKALYKK